jgi:soluble lytic murein transglycosylase
LSWVKRLAIVAVIVAATALVVDRLVGVERIVDEVTVPLDHEDVIREQAERFDLDPALIAAVINQESGFSDQTSHAGARGLMQITPETADTIEALSGGETFVYEDLSDPELNIRYGTFYLDHLLDRFDGNEIAALAAYNGGPENAAAWGGAELEPEDIEFEETRDYVDEVLNDREQYRERRAEELGL